MAHNEEAELLLGTQVAQIATDAMQELRDTIRPTFDARSLGYDNADHARLTIVTLADKKINKLLAEHLRKHGR